MKKVIFNLIALTVLSAFLFSCSANKDLQSLNNYKALQHSAMNVQNEEVISVSTDNNIKNIVSNETNNITAITPTSNPSKNGSAVKQTLSKRQQKVMDKVVKKINKIEAKKAEKNKNKLGTDGTSLIILGLICWLVAALIYAAFWATPGLWGLGSLIGLMGTVLIIVGLLKLLEVI